MKCKWFNGNNLLKTYAITFTVIQFGASVGFRFYTVCGDENYIVTSQHRNIGIFQVLEIWSNWQTDIHLTLTQMVMPLHLIFPDD